MDFETLWPLLPLPSEWLRKAEAQELYNLAKEPTPDGLIVEIGSWYGRSTVTLAMGSKNGPKNRIYAVDPHKDTYAHRKFGIKDTEKALRANLTKFNLDSLVTVAATTSVEASKTWVRPIRLLWIDGHHDYPLIDYLLWEPYLVKGGTIGLHDSDHVGATKLAHHFLERSEKFTSTRTVTYTFFAKKTWPTRPFKLRGPWDLLFITVNQWLNVISQNERTGRPWHRGLPYTWWHGHTKAAFLADLPHHLDPYKEPLWFKWEPVIIPITRAQAGNYKM